MSQSSPAVLGPVQSSVRPRAWLTSEPDGNEGDASYGGMREGVELGAERPDFGAEPLYDQAALDAAVAAEVAAERERCEGLQQLLREKTRQIETLLRGITDARCVMDPIWRERMGAESVREYVQRGLRCIDSAVTDCKFIAPNDQVKPARRAGSA